MNFSNKYFSLNSSDTINVSGNLGIIIAYNNKKNNPYKSHLKLSLFVDGIFLNISYFWINIMKSLYSNPGPTIDY